jgi:hypothetical protein
LIAWKQREVTKSRNKKFPSSVSVCLFDSELKTQPTNPLFGGLKLKELSEKSKVSLKLWKNSVHEE